MVNTLNQNIQKLSKLLEQSQDKRLLLEEMQLISKKAFDLQDKIMAELDQTEALEKDIVKVQAAFSARESIWDMMDKITAKELELRAKTHHKETPAERAKRHQEVMDEAHHCCCGHHHAEGCCHHHTDECCHHHAEKHCCCHKEKANKTTCTKRKSPCKKK